MRTEHLDWHFHLTLPWDFSRDRQTPESDRSFPDPIMSGQVLLTSFSAMHDFIASRSATDYLSLCDVDGFTTADNAGTIHSSSTPRRTTCFCATLLEAAPLRSVTGVALC
jgi:hypothetical protein